MKKLVIVAQIPPPYHGQSIMVYQLLQLLRSSASAIKIIHLNFRFSDTAKDIGKFQLNKIFSLLLYCWKFIWIYIRHQPDMVYYVPAPAKRSALYRDWVILFILRLFKLKIIFHWHAVGIGQWAAERATQSWLGKFEKKISYRCYGNADLNITLSKMVEADSLLFNPRKSTVIFNGIPDPCPEFESKILPSRLDRLEKRKAMLSHNSDQLESLNFNFLFISLCTREKGLFDALSGLSSMAKTLCPSHPSLRIIFNVCGEFTSDKEKELFEAEIRAQDYIRVKLWGFVTGELKARLLGEADCLIFPTFYPNEGLPVVLIEALAYGLPVLTTRWRAIPEITGEDYEYLLPINEPTSIAVKGKEIMKFTLFTKLRQRYNRNFTVQRFNENILKAILSL